MKLQSRVKLGATLAILAILFALQTTDAAKTDDVNVVNTPNVNVVNTPSVSVTGTPTVNVGNTASVNVANTPTVNLGNTPDVNVANTASVTAADNPAFQPYTRSAVHANRSGLDDVITFDVPSGKRLVVEFVTVRMFVANNETQLADDFVAFHLIPTLLGTTSLNQRMFVTTQSLRAYVEAGAGTVFFHVGRDFVGSNNDTFTWDASVSGYLVDVP